MNSLDPPWVARELALARRAIDTRVPVLGICFGGQMLAAAMGASVGAAASPSIGWCEVAGPRGGLVGDRRWLHFSYEAFALPEGAEQLGELGGTPAAFRRGPHLAVQFHPEATVEIVARWAQWDAARLRRLRIDPAPLIAASAERRAAARERRVRPVRLLDLGRGSEVERADALGLDLDPEPRHELRRRVGVGASLVDLGERIDVGVVGVGGDLGDATLDRRRGGGCWRCRRRPGIAAGPGAGARARPPPPR